MRLCTAFLSRKEKENLKVNAVGIATGNAEEGEAINIQAWCCQFAVRNYNSETININIEAKMKTKELLII